MRFELHPIIDIMIDFYQKPASFARFNEYLKLLADDKMDLKLPISAFNPMAKAHVLQKLHELKEMKVEQVAQDALSDLNSKLKETYSTQSFKTVLCLSDDLKGGWTNRYTADYDAKFRIQALVKRNFCAPIFWVSESLDLENVKNRVLEYCYRTVYFFDHGKPATLEDHIKQERAVAAKIKKSNVETCDLETLNSFYEREKNSSNYLTIFNFLYGDAATSSLGNTPLGIKDEYAGFKFARILASK